MPHCHHQFALEVAGPDGEPLGQHCVSPDWERGVAWLRFEALRRHGWQKAIRSHEMMVTPQWSEAGEPWVDGVIVGANGDSVKLPLQYFKPSTRLVAKQLIEEGRLKAGDLYTYKVLAYSRRAAVAAPPAPPSCRFHFEEESPQPVVLERDLGTLLARATPSGEPDPGNGLLVFIPQCVADEIIEQAKQAGSVETGGILIGHLHRDEARESLAVEITAQIPARHTSATTHSLSFTDETWSDVQAAIDLRHRGEQHQGWQHSHPSKFFCPETCAMDCRLRCARQLPFLSEDDVLLHSTVFPRPWHVAVLANNADSGLTLSCFGWDHGVIRQRGFFILDATSADAPVSVPVGSSSGRTLENQTP